LILVDSTVWIDYFNGVATPQTDKLDHLLATEPLAIGDLILTEVLQGFASEQEFNRARRLLTSLTVVHLGARKLRSRPQETFGFAQGGLHD
jgi:hypothetical protein